MTGVVRERTGGVSGSDGIAAAIDHYREHGFAVVRGVFGADDLAALRTAFDRQWAEGTARGASWRHGNLHYRFGDDANLGRVLRLAQWPSYVDPVLARYRTDPRLLAIVAPLIGRDLKQIINQLHWKPPGSAAAEFAYHQDIRFRRPRAAFRNLPDAYVQTGIAIDRHDTASGAMRVCPGSHRLGEVEIPVLGGASVMDAAMADESLRRIGLDPTRLVDLELAPGDVALWNVLMIHGSGRNATDGDRRFYLNGYVRASDCDRGEWAFRDGIPCPLGEPVLVHYDALFERPEPHYVEG